MSHYHPISGKRHEIELITFSIKDQNGKFGPSKIGEMSQFRKLEDLVADMCKCSRKARFKVTLCRHECCGCCLKKTTAVVSSERNESLDVFICPLCAQNEWGTLSLIPQKDVFYSLVEKNMCICCFQMKVFGVTKCNHRICHCCIKTMLDESTLKEYQCPWNGCGITYDLTSLIEMYTDTLSEMAKELFRKPKNPCDGKSCINMPLVGLKECSHSWCLECIGKATVLEENHETDEERLQRCPDPFCNAKFPTESLTYYIQQLKSTMQMATCFLTPMKTRYTSNIRCGKCHETRYEVLFRVQTCNHCVCLQCVRNILKEDTPWEKADILGFPTEITECPETSCLKKIPIVCIKAMELTLKGDLIGVSMFLRQPTRSNSYCSVCFSPKAYIEVIFCGHRLCLTCAKKKVSDTFAEKIAECLYSSCIGIPIQCLKDVIEKPPQEILTAPVDLFNELSKRINKAREAKCHGTDSSATACGISFDLLRPCFGSKRSCFTCRRSMAIIIFSTCGHGWCVECLKSDMAMSKDEKLQCKVCASSGHTGNANRFLIKCKTEGLLIPAYIKPIPGCTPCYCKTNHANLEKIDCGHRFCTNCLLQSIKTKCPVPNHKNAVRFSPDQRLCDACSKSKPFMSVKACRHAICEECVQQIFVCPNDSCGSIIDEASSGFLYDHISSQKEELFISQVGKAGIRCSNCRISYKRDNEIESMVQIRRCGHLICNQCFAKLQKDRENLTILGCRSEQCTEFFYLPPILGFKDSDAQQKDNVLKAEGADNVSSAGKSSLTNTKRQMSASYFESKKFTFPNLECSKNEVETKGLPNLGLSCYRNSVYQILAESPGFFSKLRSSNENVTEDWTFTLSEILWHIISKLSSKTHTEEYLLRMQQEFSAIDNSFMEYGQNDSLSFLTSLLNNITGEIEYKRKQYSRSLQDPTDTFRGQIHDKYTCCKCKKTECAGLSDFLSLPLPTIHDKNPKIGQCLYKFFEAETLKGVVTCQHCKHDTVLKESVIKKFPDILVLQLGMVSEQQKHFTKVQRSPIFWENFKGLKNNIHRSKIDMKELSEYTLFGVIVHIGGLSGGHYYSYVKRQKDEKWDLCDDSYVKQVDLRDVLSSNAYVLFYHKCPRDTAC